MMYNTFLTGFMLSAMTLLDEDFDYSFPKATAEEKVILKKCLPLVYRELRDSSPFNLEKFIFLTFSTAVLSITHAFLFFEANWYAAVGSDGQSGKTLISWSLGRIDWNLCQHINSSVYFHLE